MSLGSRLKEYIDSQHITIKEFERKNDFSNGLISRIVRENGNMSTKHLQVIGENHPDLNMDWLIKGVGEMIHNQAELSESEVNEKLKSDVEFYRRMVETLQKAVDSLSDRKE